MARVRQTKQNTEQATAPATALPTIGSARAAAAAPKLPPSPPFWLVHVPGRVGILDGRVVPLLRDFQFRSGANGVRIVKDDKAVGGVKYLLDDAREQLRSRGQTPIEWDVDAEPYLREAAPGHWASRWMTPIPGSAAVQTDMPGYVDWIESLIERRIIPPVGAHELEALCGSLRLQAQEAAKQQDTYRAEQLQAQLAVASARLAELGTGATRRKASSTTLPTTSAGA